MLLLPGRGWLNPPWDLHPLNSPCGRSSRVLTGGRSSPSGTRLIRNVVLTVRVMMVGEFWEFFDASGSSIGIEMVVSVRRMVVLRNRVGSFTFTWICTKVSGS